MESLRDERSQNKRDILDNKIPHRVPIEVYLSSSIIADYSNTDRRAAYWDPSLLQSAAEELCKMIPSDICLYGGTVYSPVTSQTLNSINKVMSSTGYMQHPNTKCMEADEYDELIADPYAFILEKCIPRLYKALDPNENPGRYIFALLQESLMKDVVARKEIPMVQALHEKFDYPLESYGGFGRATMDWVADQLRSFSEICLDVKRNRAKLIEALDAVYPMIYKIGLYHDLENIDRYCPTTFQLHMPTYLREKEFAEVFWPTWKRQMDDYAALGMRGGAFLEHNWNHLLDYVYDTPTGSYYTFEATDAKLIKEKLGKKHILGGGFPLAYLTTCSKTEIIGKTKEWLDIMAPGGQYIFGFDKGALVLSDINIENLIAVCETVRDYGVYDNPGAPTGETFKKADYIHSGVETFSSKYFRNWDDYMKLYPNTPDNARDVVMMAEESMLMSFFSMTC